MFGCALDSRVSSGRNLGNDLWLGLKAMFAQGFSSACRSDAPVTPPKRIRQAALPLCLGGIDERR